MKFMPDYELLILKICGKRFIRKTFKYDMKYFNRIKPCTIRAIRNLKRRTTNGGSRWFAVVRKLNNMNFFIIDKCFQYIPKRNAIKKYDCK
jgi:hypothetical protein